MKPLELALVTNLFPPEILGGYELLAADVARNLRERGHRVHVLTSGAKADPQRDCHRTLTLSRSFASSEPHTDRVRHLVAAAANTAAMQRFFASHPALDGALVFSLRRVGLAPLRALRAREVPTVVTVNDDWPVAYTTPADDRSLRARLRSLADRAALSAHRWGSLRLERVLWLSDTLRRTVQRAGAPLGDGTVRAQGVDRALFSFRGVRPIDARAPRLLSVGRLHPDKGPELALDALASLVRAGLDATLTVAGAAHTDAYGHALRARADQLGVASRVCWLGAVERAQLPVLYAQADALLFISRVETEGLGLTWLEAMACGLPVVALPAGGARQFFAEHGGVALATREDADGIAEAVRALIASPELQRSLIERGQAIVREHASLDGYVDALLAQIR